MGKKQKLCFGKKQKLKPAISFLPEPSQFLLKPRDREWINLKSCNKLIFEINNRLHTFFQHKNVSWDDGRESLRITVVNRGYSAEDIEFQSLFPRSAKIESFSMIQNEIHYHGKKVSHQKAHEIVRRAAADGYNAGLYVPRSIEGTADRAIFVDW